MTAPLPARLLAFRDAAESTNDDEGNDGRATYVPVSLQTFRQTMEEAAAALSGREGRCKTVIVYGDRGPEEREPVEDYYTTPQPGDGWNATDDDVRAWLARHDHEGMSLTDARSMFDDARSAHMLAAAPSAKGVAK